MNLGAIRALTVFKSMGTDRALSTEKDLEVESRRYIKERRAKEEMRRGAPKARSQREKRLKDSDEPCRHATEKVKREAATSFGRMDGA